MSLVVNGRFLRSNRPTGMHRAARSLIDHARAAGLAAEVFVPPGVDDPRADRTVWGPPGRFGDHVWEQLVLPAAARGRPLLSLYNTAPVAPHRAAVLVHDLAFRAGPAWFSRSMQAYGAVVLAAARRAQVVITVSAAMASELVAAGLRRDRVTVIWNAVADGFGPPPHEIRVAVRRRLGLERPFLVVIGWANPRKDVATVVSAHLALVRRFPHDLVLCGADSPTFRRVDLPVASSIRVLGYVDDTEVRALLAEADAFLYPTLYEGFGLPPLEALRCGTPAIVSDLPVLRESTRDQACFVPPGQPVAWEAAMASALSGGLAAGEPSPWTWADAAAALIDALQPLF